MLSVLFMQKTENTSGARRGNRALTLRWVLAWIVLIMAVYLGTQLSSDSPWHTKMCVFLGIVVGIGQILLMLASSINETKRLHRFHELHYGTTIQWTDELGKHVGEIVSKSPTDGKYLVQPFGHPVGEDDSVWLSPEELDLVIYEPSSR